MSDANRRKIYKTGEICELLEISKKTLYTLEAHGLIPAVPRDWRGWRTYDDSHLKAVRRYQTSKSKENTSPK